MKTKFLEETSLKSIFKNTDRDCGWQNVGAELEKFALDRDTLKPLPMTGTRSIQAMLKYLEKHFGWTARHEEGLIVQLSRDGQQITIEPGGQVELSCTENRHLDHAHAVEREHWRELEKITYDWNILWSGLGYQPICHINEVDWLNKPRYQIMQHYLEKKGKLSHHMMKMTSSIQVAIDFDNEQDAILKCQLLARITPMLIAMFANSCIVQGNLGKFKSFRSHVWQNTDADRCGIPRCMLEPDFNFQKYIEYALDIPIFFLYRNHEYIYPVPLTFRQFMKKGYQELTATQEDWVIHLNCIFPEIRLRNYIEIRSFDRQSSRLTYAAPVLIKALFYDSNALDRLYRLVKVFGYEDVVLGAEQAARLALKGEMAGICLNDLAAQMIEIARDSVRKMVQSEDMTLFEEGVFGELQHLVFIQKKSPADVIIDRWNGSQDLRQIVLDSCLGNCLKD